MKQTRFQKAYRKSSSKMHKKVGDLLRSSVLFRNFEAYQEYPVNRVNPYYPESSHHYDWVIPMLKIVIECHGKQHYEPVNFGGMDDLDAYEAYRNGKERDKLKKEAALSVGYRYIEVPYYEENLISDKYLSDLLDVADLATRHYTEVTGGVNKFEPNTDTKVELKQQRSLKAKEQWKALISSDKHKERLAKAREVRRAQYRRTRDAHRASRPK